MLYSNFIGLRKYYRRNITITKKIQLLVQFWTSERILICSVTLIVEHGETIALCHKVLKDVSKFCHH